MLKAGDSVNYQTNNNGPNMKLNIFYCNSIINWMIHHGTLKFTPAHINYVLVETWEDFKPTSATITQKSFKNTHLLPLSPPDIGTNHQAFLGGTQQSNIEKSGDIGRISKASIAPI